MGRICTSEVGIESSLTLLKQRARANRLEADIAGRRDEDLELLGDGYQGSDTAWDELRADVAWALRIRSEVPPELRRDVDEGDATDAEFSGEFTIEAAGRLLGTDAAPGELSSRLQEWTSRRDGIVDQFEGRRAGDVRARLSGPFLGAEDLLALLRDSVGDVEEWLDHARRRAELEAFGLAEVVDFCEEERVEADEVPGVIERACLHRWIDHYLQDDAERLGHLRADQLTPLAEEFRELDREYVRHAAAKVIEACNARRPRTALGGAGTIKREAEKKKRHMPVRRLLEETSEVAQRLKPCFMMSPLTVSQFLPPEMRFDCVIFDEASQVRPSDAVNCIYRGKSLVVAGDEMQLPPTSFFEVMTGDDGEEWEEDQFDEFDSILHLCKAGSGLRELPLRWHYRSQHESLITYSNEAFYASRQRPLVTFPGAVQEADDLGVEFILVPDGVYRRGTTRDNPIEAAKVVERVLHWARYSIERKLDLTVGVVAFSEAQATAIETELETRRRELPELDSFFGEDRLDGFFVKNLENVQGDERDVMLFSIGYGRDEVGKFTMNFGPLNREGGKRRLNVAISRARRRVEVVSSVDSSDFPAEINAEGVRHLQRYLDYAKRGVEALALDIGPSELDAESPFEEEVLRVVRSWGYDCQPQVGVAEYRVDIGVRNPARPGEFVLGIECDGAMYHSSKVARDRDRLRQEVLQRLGWRIHRIWGTAWYRNREDQEVRLREAIESATEEGP